MWGQCSLISTALAGLPLPALGSALVNIHDLQKVGSRQGKLTELVANVLTSHLTLNRAETGRDDILACLPSDAGRERRAWGWKKGAGK